MALFYQLESVDFLFGTNLIQFGTKSGVFVP